MTRYERIAHFEYALGLRDRRSRTLWRVGIIAGVLLLSLICVLWF